MLFEISSNPLNWPLICSFVDFLICLLDIVEVIGVRADVVLNIFDVVWFYWHLVKRTDIWNWLLKLLYFFLFYWFLKSSLFNRYCWFSHFIWVLIFSFSWIPFEYILTLPMLPLFFSFRTRLMVSIFVLLELIFSSPVVFSIRLTYLAFFH